MTGTKNADRSSATRGAIRDAAEELFAAEGFAAASVRDIARRAGVDPALVIRYFGSKEALFLETMSLDDGFARIAEAPVGELGEAIVARLLQNRDGAGSYYRALMRAADRQEVRTYIRRLGETFLIEPLTRRLTGEDVDARARLIGAQVSGLLTSLWTLEDPALGALSAPAIVRIYGSALQTLIDGPRP